jgi:hypothetical protein
MLAGELAGMQKDLRMTAAASLVHHADQCFAKTPLSFVVALAGDYQSSQYPTFCLTQMIRFAFPRIF